jgi:hypothetical protein
LKNLEKNFALKSFFNINNATMKEIVREVIWYLINFIYFSVCGFILLYLFSRFETYLVKNST